MKYLMGLCCYLVMIAAFGGDDGAFENPRRDADLSDERGTEPESLAPDATPQADRAVEARGDGWRPRLILELQADIGVSRTVREAYTEPVEGLGVSEVKYREKVVRLSPSRRVESGVLYCDAVLIDVTKDGNNPVYILECADRIHLRVNGLLVDAESGRFAMENVSW